MSWTAILLLAAGAFAFKLAGVAGLGRYAEHPVVIGLGQLLPPALLAALIVDGTFNDGNGALVLDARAAGVALGGLAAFYRAPFWLVVLIAAASTAMLRQF